MKIGLLAMSGVRAHDPKLLEMGLTLPGFVERSKAVARLPSLGLLYLAAVTPGGHEVRYFEAEGDGREPGEVYSCDLVAISTFSAQVFETYAIADRLRAAGMRVAMGGLHVSVMEEEARAHADYVIVGEGENVWPEVVKVAEGERRGRDVRGTGVGDRHTECDGTARGRADSPLESRAGGAALQGASGSRLGRVFRASEYPAVDVRALPVPRYELLAGREYNRFTVQTSRGCPWRCEFCASTVMLGRPYRKRRVEDVVRDIEAVKGVAGRRPFVEFADDNTFVDKEWGKELCRRMRGMGVRWFTETDVTVGEDGELLGLMREAGCRQVLVGLESPSAGPLAGLEMRRDAKRRWAAKYGEAIRRIQGEGVSVNGCFVLGLDGHGPGVFREVLEFAEEHSLYDVQITVLTAFPGTPLYERLLREGRIVEPGRWELCTLFDVNYEPRGMTREELREGMYWLTERLYSAEGTGRRREGFFRTARRGRVRV